MKETALIRSDQFHKQPLWFSLLNKAWKGCYPIGAGPSLKLDSLIKAARSVTSLKDFGSDPWEEPLNVMLRSINQEAKLHPIGQFITRQRLINLLAVRLRAEHYFKKFPGILEQELHPSTVIIGLQRTGTTKLQRLLATDPGQRGILSWEALNPAPIKGDIRGGEERIKIARTSVRALRYMSPGFFAIHPVEYESPEEDVLLLDVSFMSTTTEATMNVPSYAAWLEKTDQSPAYFYMVKLLKLLQWQQPKRRWVLKTPHHLEFLPLVKDHLKDVQFIWTHRKVEECIPSFLSMICYSRVLFSDDVDQKSVADHWIRKNAYMLSKAVDYRKNEGNERLFTDIFYEDLVEDPMTSIERIYEDRGEAVSPAIRQVFIEENRNNPKDKYGSHQYDISEFGTSRDHLRQVTREYSELREKLRS